jgi:hypothetical protein
MARIRQAMCGAAQGMKSSALSLVVVLLTSTGCKDTRQPKDAHLMGSDDLIAMRANSGVRFDAVVRDPAWGRAKAVTLDTPLSWQKQGKALEETGVARLLWDDSFLYVEFEFEDSDLVAFGQEDDLEHCQLGDVAEVFLKPDGETWYWEFHVTPSGKVSTYFYPGRGRFGLPSAQAHVKPRFIEASVRLRGTLNDWRDRDKGWNATVAIPWRELDRFAAQPGQSHDWRILLSRYNYTRYRTSASGAELSSFPVLSDPSYHLVQEFAWLKFQ